MGYALLINGLVECVLRKMKDVSGWGLLQVVQESDL